MAARQAIEWTKDRGGRGALRAKVGDVSITVEPWRDGPKHEPRKRVIRGWGWHLYASPSRQCHIERWGGGLDDVTPASAQARGIAAARAVQRAVDAMRKAVESEAAQ